MASFFLVFLSFGSAASNTLINLSNSSTWQALLHSDKNKAAIQDPEFLLSHDQFSLLRELEMTIDELNNNKQAICTFPARALWLANHNVIEQPNFEVCEGLSEFIEKVPVDDLYLVFSAENLAQPSSMMGHILLKTQGKLSNGLEVEYGITYFTEIDAINLPKTLYQTLFSGSQGYFALSPYQDNLSLYINKEQRNVWEYQLDISDLNKQLIQLHFWELKSKDLKYFFVEYNCATLINFVLSIADARLTKHDQWWLTPLDVVKQVNKVGLVKNTNVIASTDWKIRMLSESVKTVKAEQLVSFFEEHSNLPTPEVSDTEAFLQLELLSEYYAHAKENGTVELSEYQNKHEKLKQLKAQRPEFVIELSNYKLPTKTPNDSKLTFQYVGNNAEELRVRFTPASHHLGDDNRQYFAESELKLGELSLSIEENNSVNIHSFNLYSMMTLTPFHPLTGGISGGFHIRYQHQNTSLVEKDDFFDVGGQVGITKQLTSDMSVYTLFSLDLSMDKEQVFVTGGPKIGMIIYEIFDMKSVVELTKIYNSGNNGFDYTQLRWQQSWFLSQDWQLELDVIQKMTHASSNTELGFCIHRHF